MHKRDKFGNYMNKIEYRGEQDKKMCEIWLIIWIAVKSVYIKGW